jgi:DNA (cytosine-5)-methyltransferase 1
MALPKMNKNRGFASKLVEVANMTMPLESSHKTFAEFFAGIGLVRLALEAEGWKADFANDIDPDKQATYAKNFSADEFIRGDINALSAKDVPSTFLATASFPCTDLSLAGAREGLMGSESGTLWSFLGIIEKMRSRAPKLLLLENVSGFLSSHGGRDFRAAVEKMNSIGYACDAILLNAVHFVPQSRQRLFILAVQRDVLLPYEAIDDPALLSEHPARPEQLLRALNASSDLQWRFRRFLGPLGNSRKLLNEVMEEIPYYSPLWWNAKRTSHLLGQLSKRHADTIRHLKDNPRETWATVYKRMRAGHIRAEVRCDGVAGCLRTPRGGSSKQFAILLGKGRLRVRHMTPREYARLQGVPDSFKFDENVNKALFGFGDAICVPAVRWLTRQLINPIVDALERPETKKELAISASI